MKRLNRKGFTLVELLAVIVILAILVGIVLVTVLPTLSDFRKNAFKTSAQVAADYFEKQYQLYVLDGSHSLKFSGDDTFPLDIQRNIRKGEVESAGLKPSNYDLAKSYWKVNTSTGRVCVTLVASSVDGSEFYDVGTEPAKSTGCN